MKNTVWKLFEKTGNTAYYELYKRLSQEENTHKDNRK